MARRTLGGYGGMMPRPPMGQQGPPPPGGPGMPPRRRLGGEQGPPPMSGQSAGVPPLEVLGPTLEGPMQPGNANQWVQGSLQDLLRKLATGV